MARINDFQIDGNIGINDILVGSEFNGIGANNRAIYITKNYRIGDIGDFLGLSTNAISTHLGSFNSDGSFSYSSSFASQTLSTVATAGYAAASSVTQLNTRVNIVLPNGGTTVAQSFANSVLSSSSSGLFATSQYAQNLGSSFGSVDANGNVVVSASVANSILATMNTSSLASASSVTQLNSTLTNDYRTTTATNTQINQSVATETSARASAVTTLNSSISIKPNILRATSAPTITQRITAGSGQSGAVTTAQDPAMGSLWIDTTATAVTAANGSVSQQPKNEFYVLQGSFGSAAWLKSQDASLLNTITSAATATSNLSTLTTADQARAAQVTKLNAQFTFSGGNINGVADALNTSINTAVSNGTGAISTSVDELKTQFSFDGNNITGVSDALNTSINTASSNAVSATASSLDKLEALFQFDGSGNVNGLTGSTIISSAIATSETNAVSTANSARATAQDNLVATISKVFRQNDAPAVTEPVNSIWYDTNDSNKSYILVAGSPRVWTYTVDATLATSASVDIVSSAAANINGKLAARYAMKVATGNVFAGMELMSNSDATGAVSDIIFTATNFKVKTIDGSGNVSPVAPFTVSGANGSNVVSINGTLKIGGASGTSLTDVTSKANAATTASAASTASNTQDKDDGSVGGWTLESGYIYSGTKQTSDTYSAAGITLYSGGTLRAKNFYIANNGDAYFKGILSSPQGLIGGFTIGSSAISTVNKTSLADNDAGVYLGTDGIALGVNSPFKVTAAGALTAGSANITGVITATSGSIANGVTIGGTQASTVKNGAASGATANQSSNATIRAVGAATSGEIAGIKISGSELYQGAGNFNNADTGFYLGSNGKFSLKDKLSWNGTTLTINGNGTFSGALSAASGDFTGEITADEGTIGGWIIDSGVLESSNSDVKINSGSGSSGIEMFDTGGTLRLKISPTGSVTNPLVTGDVSVGNQAQEANETLTLNSSVFAGSFSNPSGNPTSINLRTSANAAGGTLFHNSRGSGTVGGATGATVGYTLVIPLNSGILGVVASGTRTGWTISAIFGVRITTSSTAGSGTVIADHSFSVSSTGLGLPHSAQTFTGSFVATSSDYRVHSYVKKVRIVGTLTTEAGSNTNVSSVTIKAPAVTVSATIAAELSELTSGGLLISKDTDAFLRVNRASNSLSSPFIRSRGFMEHQGRLTVLNASGASGTGDIYLGGDDGNTSGYMRIFSNANDHKYIEWGDPNTTVQLKLRYNGNQKFQFGSTGVFDANSTKNFKINHLLESKKETHYLRHAAIEAPQADLIYRGKITLSNGTATVNIDEVSRMSDGTFSLLCRDVQCFTSNETGWDAVKASVSNNTLTINCQNTNSSDEISWMVIAERKDPSYIDSDVTDDNGLYKTESEKED